MDIISYLQNRKIGISSKIPPIGFFNSSGYLSDKLRFVFLECNRKHLWGVLRNTTARDFFKTEHFKEIKKQIEPKIDNEQKYLISLLFVHIFLYLNSVGIYTYKFILNQNRRDIMSIT